MYDPVLNRPMFQAQNTASPMAAAPMGAKGTGITSMVTSPDPDTTAQQLRAFANPAMPTVGYADGGLATQDAFNAFLNRQNGLADNAPRDEYRPTGLGGKNLVIGQPMVPDEYRPTGLGGKNLVMGQPGTPEPASQSSMRAAVSSPSPMDPRSQSPLGASSMGGGESYDIFKSGLASTQSPSNSPSSISGKGVIIQTYADGGPVQHFQQGGPAVSSMWDNFVNSLTIKEPNRSGNYRLPDLGLRIGQQNDYRRDAGITGGEPNYVEPIDVGGPDAVMSEEQRNAVYMRNAAAQQAEDPRVAANLENDDAVRERQQATRDAGIPSAARIQEAVGSGASNAMLPRVLNRNPGPDLLEQQQREMGREADRGAGFRNIGQEARPPMPGPGIQIDTTEKPRGEISTRLADIKSERASQSAADRRENALMALMSAGFGMAAGKSRHALQNIAEGGQQGIGTFAQLEKGRREDENRRYLSALHEKEVALRERDLEARLPLIAAQTKVQEALPEQRRQTNEIRAGVAQSHAQQMADKAFKDIMSNPMSAEFKAISSDKTGTVAPAIKKKLEEKYFNDKYKELMLQKNDGLGIRSVTQPSE